MLMRRLGCITGCLKPFASRRFGDAATIETPAAVRDMIAAEEREQQQKELAVDTRSVVFASAASADHRPRIAAAEAFDVAAAALPRPPNFCVMHISLDYTGMIDAPEVVWFNLCKTNDVTPSTVRPQQLHMMGGAVRHQRLGGGYIQVMLGCIPDLETDVFTFDAIPEADELDVPDRPPPALCFALLDNKLTLQYERVLSGHLQELSARLGSVPLVGGVYPPAPRSASGESNAPSEMGDSICFINDRVYTGSAAGVVLRSAAVKAHRVGVVPSISVGSVKVTGLSCTDGLFTLSSLGDRRATDVIREAYSTPELEGTKSKIFLGVRHGSVCVPIAFVGHPETGELQFYAPSGVQLAVGGDIELLVDDSELDSEAAAGLLIALRKKVSILHVTKDINVAREARKNTVASTSAAFHFSHHGMNVMARPEVNLTLGSAPSLFAPSILQRCVGQQCPTTGIFCPGQIVTVGDVTSVYARCSTYCLLEGLK